MDSIEPIRLNGDLIRRARLARRLSQRIVAGNAQMSPAQLQKLESSGRCERLTLAALFKLAETLSVEPATLLQHPSAGETSGPDDVVVEAALASIGKAVNRDDIAWALGWELGRVDDALLVLASRLQGTGQRLALAKFGWYRLTPAEGALSKAATANLRRAAIAEYGIKLNHARILRRLAQGERLKPSQARGRWGRVGNPFSILGGAGLVDFDGGEVCLTEAAAFSLCLDGVRTTPSPEIKPMARRMRAPYSGDHRPGQGAD